MGLFGEYHKRRFYSEVDDFVRELMLGSNVLPPACNTLFYKKFPFREKDKNAILEWYNNMGKLDINMIKERYCKQNNSPQYLDAIIRKEIRFRENIIEDYISGQRIKHWEKQKQDAENAIQELNQSNHYSDCFNDDLLDTNSKILFEEVIPEFCGMKDVLRIIYENGLVLHKTDSWTLEKERIVYRDLSLQINCAGYPNNTLLIRDSENNVIGKYIMDKNLRGYTSQFIEIKKNQLVFYSVFNTELREWEQHVTEGVNSVLWLDGATIHSYNGIYWITNNAGEYLVPPGIYDYIEGFRWCKYARVRKKTDNYPSKLKNDTSIGWGLLNTEGKEVLTPIYSEVKIYKEPTKIIVIDKKSEDNHTELKDKYMFDLSTCRIERIESCVSLLIPEANRACDYDDYNVYDDYPGDTDTLLLDAVGGEEEALWNID